MTRVYSNRLSEYTHENGGRVLLLFLLFLVALYELSTSGFTAFALICIIPFVLLYVIAAFKWRMFTFWSLVIVNYLIQMKDIPLPVPMSLPNEILQIILLSIAIVDARQTSHFERTTNVMLLALIVWCGFCTLELLNDTCDLGIDFAAWYTGARLMAFQILYTFIVFSIYISSPEILMRYLKLWAILSLFSVFWVWKQQHLGFTTEETIWIQGRGRTTHILNAGTLIRYFSTFSDAANYGINAAATTVAFILFGITSRIKKDRIFFILTGVLVFWGMFASGTRTAIFCVAAGFIVYIFLSKSIKIAVPFSIFLAICSFILVFTEIGNGNQQVRRMRSAFKSDDASANVRDINKDAVRKYIKDAPWGIGLGMGYNVPANNKYAKLATIPPDSEYVYIWIRTGPIGITIFVITTLIMLIGACCIVFFKLKSRSLMGIGAGFCCAFVSIQLGGYANQVLMQFPNCVIFYGGLSIVYILPFIEPEWIKYEEKRLAEQEEKKRLKLEKKLASRV
jgi:hypothetical protein